MYVHKHTQKSALQYLKIFKVYVSAISRPILVNTLENNTDLINF